MYRFCNKIVKKKKIDRKSYRPVKLINDTRHINQLFHSFPSGLKKKPCTALASITRICYSKVKRNYWISSLRNFCRNNFAERMLITITYYLKHFLRLLVAWILQISPNINFFKRDKPLRLSYANSYKQRIHCSKNRCKKHAKNALCKILEILEINVANRIVSRPNCVIRSCYPRNLVSF